VGFNEPQFKLPRNFDFHSLGTTNLPANEWSTGLMNYLSVCHEELIVLMLEDYWLFRPVNIRLVNSLYDRFSGIANGKKVLRIDLTNDRAVRKQKRPYINQYGYDLIYTPPHTPYQMSYQAAIWDVATLFDCLKVNENPWQSEVNGTERLKHKSDIMVLGTENRPLVYKPVYRSKQNAMKLDKIPQDIISELEERGCLP